MPATPVFSDSPSIPVHAVDLTVSHNDAVAAELWNVSYSSFDVQKDESYTGQGSVELRRRDLRLRHQDHV